MTHLEIFTAIFNLIKSKLDQFDWENTKDNIAVSFDVKYKDCELMGVQLNDTISICCTAKVQAIMGETKVSDVESTVWLEVFDGENKIDLNYPLFTAALESKINIMYS